MTDHSVRLQRIRAAWRTSACTAGLCVGAQLFLAGCAVAMPLALSSAWLAALPALPLAAWLCARCRMALMQPASSSPRTRAGYLFLFASLLGCAAFALLSMTGFAAQTLAQQAKALWIEAAALAAVVLCALSGGTGAARLCFALRWLLPLLVLGLSLVDLPMRVPVGLFPLLGDGAGPLSLAAVAMLFGAAPALLLALPPQELEQAKEEAMQCVPDVRFFVLRMLGGAFVGVLLLFLASACTTYESIAQSVEWGERLRMAAGNQPHEGLLQMSLTLAKLMAMLLLSVNMLCAAQRALGRALPRLHSRHAKLILCVVLLAAILLVQAVWGDRPILLGTPVITITAVPAALLLGRRKPR